MSARTKIILLMLLTLGLYLFFIFSVNEFNGRQLAFIIEESRNQKIEQLNELIDLLGKAEKTFATDYTFWDEMVDFVKGGGKNTKFAHQNIDASIESFEVDAVWIFDTKRELVYFVGSPGGKNLKDSFAVPEAVFAELYKKRVGHYFIRTPQGILELYSATIHPTADSERSTNPEGYFFVGRFFGKKAIDELSRLIFGKVVIRETALPPLNLGNQGSTSALSSVFTFTRSLKDWTGGEIAWLDAEVHSVVGEHFEQASASLVESFVVFGLLLLGVLFFLLYFFVSRPLEALSESIAEKKPAGLKGMEQESGEFGRLAVTIQQFFDQQVKIEQEKARSEALLESINDGIIGIDRNWNIVFVNSSVKNVFELPVDGALGKPLRDHIKILRARDRSENLVFIEEALLYGKISSTDEETLVLNRNGKEISIASSAAPIFDTDKKTSGAVIIMHDVTKENQSRLLRSDFAYASHQLRTPVTEAIWAVNTALEVKDPKKKDKDIRIAEKSIQSVRKLVEHLLEVSQLDQETIIPRLEKTKISDILGHIANRVSSRARERKIVLRLPSTIASRLILVTDSRLLERILFEVVENAVLYGNPRSAVEVSFEKQSKGTLFKVHSVGRPILEKELPLIFTKFFRGSGVPEEIPGAGLGLYIAREYARLLGGKIWFTSSGEDGTTFFVFLPKA